MGARVLEPICRGCMPKHEIHGASFDIAALIQRHDHDILDSPLEDLPYVHGDEAIRVISFGVVYVRVAAHLLPNGQPPSRLESVRFLVGN